MANIYELSENYLQLMALMEDPEIDEESLQSALSEVKDDIKTKVDGYAGIRKSLVTESYGIDAEIARLNERKDRIIKNIDRIDTNLLNTFDKLFIKEMKTELNSAKIYVTKYVNLIDEEKIDDRFKSEKITKTVKVSKADIKKAINEGEVVEGAEILERKKIKFK